MRKIFIIFGLLLFFAGCACDEVTLPDEPDPPVNSGNSADSPYEPEQHEPPVHEPEPTPPVAIPERDEHRAFLTISPAERLVSGSSHITFTNRTGGELETVVLRVYLNAFCRDAENSPVFPELEWRAFPNGREYGNIGIEYAFANDEPLSFELDETVLTLKLNKPLAPYQTVRLFLLYTAEIPQIAHRTGGNENALWFGKFLPTLAVYDNGWNTDAHYPAGNPFFVQAANYRVEITTPSRYTVVGTGTRTEEVIIDTDTKITRFTANHARDFAFALSPHFLTAQAITETGVTIHLYYFTETLNPEQILESALRSMNFFEERISVFPLGHVTIVEAELMQDSIAFSQVVFADSWYLARGGQYRAIAHGLGNQWLSQIVGTNRVAEPWLTNGLTRFVQAGVFYQDADTLRSRMERDYVTINERTTLIMANGLGASPNWAHYAHTHGRKAMLMTYNLHELVGEEVFWQIISEYYRRFAFEIADANDFINLAEEISGRNLQNFFSRWINEGTVPGLP
ncbi:MAG: M1 family metallopeptidase [Defluviitaleaceae bacterium]|nr:M1 family metallopeptidase [Defluviitaleaceae bacterium]